MRPDKKPSNLIEEPWAKGRGGNSTGAPVAEAVRSFYEEYPFPGFNLRKYSFRRDLYLAASWYARMIDRSLPSGVRVVDLGCGTGQLALLLGLKNRKVLGVDFSRRSVEKARALKEKLRVENTEFLEGDLLSLPIADESFDYALCNGVLHHMADPFAGFRSLCRILRPGGYLVLGLYNRYGRAIHHLRQIWVQCRGSPQSGHAAEDFYRRQFIYREHDEEKKESWFADQFLHPHESHHTVSEVLGWFRSQGVHYVSSLPPIEPFARLPSHLFRRSPMSRLRSNPLAHLLVQWTWIFTQHHAGGYFVMIGQKA